jgi:hypothetical protein
MVNLSARGTAVAVLALVGAIAAAMAVPLATQLQADSYKALYDGSWIAHHGLPHRDALTVLAHGRPWIDEQWLADLTLYGAWLLGGYALVACTSVAAVATAYMLLASLLLRRGASPKVAICTTVLAILTLTGWDFIRAQDFALTLFAALLSVCAADACSDERPRRVLLLLPILVIWANVHGSVLLGAGLAALYLSFRAVRAGHGGFGRSARAYAALAAVVALTPLATPYGVDIVRYYAAFAGNKPMARLAVEWAPAPIGSFAFYELWIPALLVMVALGVAVAKRHRPPVALLGATAITGAAAALESGSIVWFGMTAAVLLADVASAAWTAPLTFKPRTVCGLAFTASALFAAVVVQLASRPSTSFESLLPTRVLRAAVVYLDANRCSAILADNLSSSALLWHYPRLDGRLAYDARLESYSQAALTRWLRFEDPTRRTWLDATAGFRVLLAQSTYAPELFRRLEQFPPSQLLARQSEGVAVINRSSVSCSHPVRAST